MKKRSAVVACWLTLAGFLISEAEMLALGKTAQQREARVKRGVETQGGLEILAQCTRECGVRDEGSRPHHLSLELVDDEDNCANVCNVTYVKKNHNAPKSSYKPLKS